MHMYNSVAILHSNFPVFVCVLQLYRIVTIIINGRTFRNKNYLLNFEGLPPAQLSGTPSDTLMTVSFSGGSFGGSCSKMYGPRFFPHTMTFFFTMVLWRNPILLY